MIRTITRKVETKLPESVYVELTRIGSEIGIGKSRVARICLHATLELKKFPLIPNLIITPEEREKMIKAAKIELIDVKPEIALSVNVSKILRKQIEDKAEMYDLKIAEIVRLFVISSLNDVDMIKEFNKKLDTLDSVEITDVSNDNPKNTAEWLWGDENIEA